MRRREVMAGLGAAALAARAARGEGLALDPLLPEGTRAEAVMAALPDKDELVKLTYRPPNYETPASAFVQAVTPNRLFFVRYHLAGIPDLAELKSQPWTVRVGGDAALRPTEISLDSLRRDFDAVEIEAVNQCSGNRRGLCEPHVPGVQWGPGAMGSAVWRGVRLHDVLARAGLRREAVEIAFAGADGPVMPVTPPFRKSLPLARAKDEDVILAYAMNGADLPHYNGYPLRLVVPGWTGTYWMKHLREIEIRSQPLDSFWMRKAYRVPKDMFPVDLPFGTQADPTTVPITEIVVNSLIANLADGDRRPASGFSVQGVAWDRGHGIARVEVSADGGKSWKDAALGADRGRYGFRGFAADTGPLQPGTALIMARATSASGETQATALKRNPGGYHNNVPIALQVRVE
jgi:DMSO/TMAO reductase YedYZ molybdopterin-dependent catalytic subunit